MSDIIQINGVYGGYDAIQVLMGIDLRIQSGKVTAILGLNGMGKTTLMRTIAGLLPATRGEIRFDGDRINGIAPHVISERGLILVPEGHPAFRDMTVEENLLIGAFAVARRQAARAKLDRIYTLFPHLNNRRTQIAGSLSGGESQMLALGRALMGEPKVLLVDEPSLGLAPVLVKEIFRSFQRLKEEGLTILLVEQNTRKALELADHVYVLANGRVALSSPRVSVTEEALHSIYFGQGRQMDEPAASPTYEGVAHD